MTKFTGVLFGMGNPLLDISANVDDAFLTKYDLKLDTAILAEDKHQSLYEDMIEKYKDNVQYIAGGATQNSMRVAQWMLKHLQPEKYGPNSVAFMGCVGPNDEYGNVLEQCASKDGVFVHYMKETTKNTPTGTCAALIVGGERALVANLSAANCFHVDHLQTETAQDIINHSKIYYSAGFFLTVSVESLVQVAEHCVTNNKIVCLNLSAPFIIDFFTEQLATAIEYCDYLFGNESEAATYATKHNLPVDDLRAVAIAICKLPKKNTNRPRTVVFTQGHKSTIVATLDPNTGVEQVTEYPVELLDKNQLVDTNGAGDAFVGGFLSQLVLEKKMEDCVKAGHYAARCIIQVSGTSLEKITYAYEEPN